MVKKPAWWEFFRVGEDGWSSEFQSVDRLLAHLKRKGGSLGSRNGYCYNLWVICLWIALGLKDPKFDLEKLVKNLQRKWVEVAEYLERDIVDPDSLIVMAKEKPEIIAHWIQKLADRYLYLKSFNYANLIIASAKAFFNVNKTELDLEGHTKHTRSGRKRQEYIPSLTEALKMADVAGGLRNRLIILILTYTGLRNSTLRALVYNEAYPDPLLQEYTIKKQLKREEKFLAIIVDEVMKEHVPNAAKNNLRYYTFIPPKVTEYLRLYVDEMERKYGALRDDQPIFHTHNTRISLSERLRTHISNRELQCIVKSAAKRAGIKSWEYVYPHCLRKTYDSFLRDQSETTRLDIQDRQFVFGHLLPGSQDVYYKKTDIEKMRVKYSKMVFEPVVIETEERVAKDDELQTLLQQGWRFVAALQSGKVVVSRQVRVKVEDIKIASNTHGENSLPQNEKAEKCAKVNADSSTTQANDGERSGSILESNSNPSVTHQERHNSQLKTISSSKASAKTCSGNDTFSGQRNSATTKEKDSQNSVQKTLLNFGSFKEN